MYIRKHIFSSSNSESLGLGVLTAIAEIDYTDATPDTSPISTLTNFTLTAVNSTSLPSGTVNSWLWEVVNSSLSITSPTSEITALSGTLINGITHTFRLTVGDDMGNSKSTNISFSVSIAPASEPIITNSPSSWNAGALDITGGTVGGTPDELGVIFTLAGDSGYPLNSPDAIIFSGVTSSGDLAYYSSSYRTTITLDAAGNFTSSYTTTGDRFQCNVRILTLNGASYNNSPSNITTITINSSEV